MGEYQLAGHLGEMVLAAGALGTAAFGIVEAAKWSPLGEAGFSNIPRLLGPALMQAVTRSLGPDALRLLRAQYRRRDGNAELARTLRQGVRIGLDPANAESLAQGVGSVDPAALRRAAEALSAGQDLDSAQRNAIGRFELAADARIDSALTLAQDSYLGAVRLSASSVAVGMALLAALVLGKDPVLGLIVGVAAVPLAPIANDIVGALQAATRALRNR